MIEFKSETIKRDISKKGFGQKISWEKEGRMKSNRGSFHVKKGGVIFMG